MSSVVDICNMALSHIRAGSINNIEETNPQAQQCKLWYYISRDQILSETTWRFSRKIKPLALSTEVIFTYAYVYVYPNDCLIIDRLVGSYEEITAGGSGVLSSIIDPNLHMNSNRKIPYDIFNVDDTQFIGANEPDLRIDYIAKVTNTTIFTTAFQLALSHLLASNIAISIVGVDLGRKLRSDSLQLYQKYLSSAIARDANEKYHEKVESEFVTIRN